MYSSQNVVFFTRDIGSYVICCGFSLFFFRCKLLGFLFCHFYVGFLSFEHFRLFANDYEDFSKLDFPLIFKVVPPAQSPVRVSSKTSDAGFRFFVTGVLF